MTPITVGLDDITFVGSGLSRPECVLCTPAGDLYIVQRGAGVTHLTPDGHQTTIGDTAQIDGKDWVPNGLDFAPDGGFLVANMGEGGGVWHLARNGTVTPWLLEVDGEDLPKANFVFTDHLGRIWVTMSTRSVPITLAMTGLGQPERADGFICLIDDKGARIVADGLTFTNEARLDRAGDYLYVAETFGRRITRFRVAADGSLSDRETFATFGHGTFADGIAFDEEDCLWVTSVLSNRLFRITPDGTQHLLLEDADAADIDKAETSLAEGLVERLLFSERRGRTLGNIASVAFGGSDLRTVYLGSLGGTSLAVFRSPVAGLPLGHWRNL